MIASNKFTARSRSEITPIEHRNSRVQSLKRNVLRYAEIVFITESSLDIHLIPQLSKTAISSREITQGKRYASIWKVNFSVWGLESKWKKTKNFIPFEIAEFQNGERTILPLETYFRARYRALGTNISYDSAAEPLVEVFLFASGKK